MSKKLLREWIRQRILLEKAFVDISGGEKGKEFSVQSQLRDPTYDGLRDEIITLINQSYAYLTQPDGSPGKNYDYSEADHLLNNDLTWSVAWDLDEDPEPDVFRGGKAGGKITVQGNDGSAGSTGFSKQDGAARLRSGQYWSESSGASAGANMKAGIPAITDEATVREKLGPKKEITWHGVHPEPGSLGHRKSQQYGPNGEYDGWYERNVSGHMTLKMMFGG